MQFNLLSIPTSAKAMDSSNPASLIYIHGIGGSYAVWYFHYILQFYGRYHQLAYDMRGHGQSDYPSTGYHVHDHAQDLCQLANSPEVNKQKRVFIGYSYGGCVLLEYAAHFATQDDRIIILDAPYVDRINQEVIDELRELRLALLGEVEVPVGSLASEFKAAMGDIDPKTRSIARYAHRLEKLLSTDFSQQSIQNASPTPAQLAAIPCTVLLIYAQHADCLAFADYLMEHIPKCRQVTLDAKHDLISTHHKEIRTLIEEQLMA